MKYFLSVAILAASVFSTAQAADVDVAIKAFQDYGITKCDHVVREEMNLDSMSNWAVRINKHLHGIDGNATEVTMTAMYGVKNDSVRIGLTIIQTPKSCNFRTVSTVTMVGKTCAEATNGARLVDSYPLIDYLYYESKTNVSMYAKELTVGGQPLCVVDYDLRAKRPAI